MQPLRFDLVIKRRSIFLSTGEDETGKLGSYVVIIKQIILQLSRKAGRNSDLG